MDKKSLLSLLAGLILGVAMAAWSVSAHLEERYSEELKQQKAQYDASKQSLELKLASFCSGESIGPGIRATEVMCGDKHEVCICGTPRR
tara:strand:- start:1363 stop:1629 length:267 start_codon:yes stop_codon:yes gene_type:complete